MDEQKRISELEFMRYLSANPGSTFSEISKGLDWSYGRTYAIFGKLWDELAIKDVFESGRNKIRLSVLKPEEYLEESKE